MHRNGNTLDSILVDGGVGSHINIPDAAVQLVVSYILYISISGAN